MSAGDIIRLCWASEGVCIANGRISFHSRSHHSLRKVSHVLYLINLIIQLCRKTISPFHFLKFILSPWNLQTELDVKDATNKYAMQLVCDNVSGPVYTAFMAENAKLSLCLSCPFTLERLKFEWLASSWTVRTVKEDWHDPIHEVCSSSIIIPRLQKCSLLWSHHFFMRTFVWFFITNYWPGMCTTAHRWFYDKFFNQLLRKGGLTYPIQRYYYYYYYHLWSPRFFGKMEFWEGVRSILKDSSLKRASQQHGGAGGIVWRCYAASGPGWYKRWLYVITDYDFKHTLRTLSGNGQNPSAVMWKTCEQLLPVSDCACCREQWREKPVIRFRCNYFLCCLNPHADTHDFAVAASFFALRSIWRFFSCCWPRSRPTLPLQRAARVHLFCHHMWTKAGGSRWRR